MNAYLRNQLTITDPGPWQTDLLGLGVFRMIGRVPAGQSREVQVSAMDRQGRVVLPRGLLGSVRRRVGRLAVRDARLYFHPLDFHWVGQLRPEQYALVRAMVQQGGNGVAESITGSGKTAMGLALIAQLQQPALWVTHRKDLALAVREAALRFWQLPSTTLGYIGEGESRIGSHLTIAMIQTLARRENTDLIPRIGTIITDECFPATTQVAGRSIAQIRIGDWIPTWDAGDLTFGRVTRVFQRPAPAVLLRIHAGKATVITTLNHPFLTIHGWKLAQDLTLDDVLVREESIVDASVSRLRKNGSTSCRTVSSMPLPTGSTTGESQSSTNRPLQSLRNRICFNESAIRLSEGDGQSLLQSRMRRRLSEKAIVRDYAANQFTGSRSVSSEDDGTQSDVSRSLSDQGFSHIESHEAWAQNSWRQWSSINRAPTTARRLFRRLALRMGSSHRSTTSQRISDRVQTRYCLSRVSIGYRNRRIFPFGATQSRTRSPKNGVLTSARVDDLTILERGSDGTFGGLCPDGLVYNLEVESAHTYVANGFVVHNCHHIPALTYHAVLSQFPAKYRIGLTGTYEREDGLHPLMGAIFGPRIQLPDSVLVQLHRVILPTVIPVYTQFQAPAGLSWAHLQQARAADPTRNLQLLQSIRQLVRQGRYVLVLVSRVDHAQWLAHQLSHNHLPAAAIIGTMPVSERQQWYRHFLVRRCVLVATSLADEGLDLPQCDTLVFATPGKSVTTLRQRAGRVMRPAIGKTDARIYDWVDGQVPVFLKHWQRRQAVYTQRQWIIQEEVREGAIRE